MSLRYQAIRPLAPLIRLLPPWYRVRAYHRIVGRPFEANALTGTVVKPVQPHGYRMELNLGDWSERMAALIGTYYQLSLTDTLALMLRPGDTFLDVGGNVGFVSLCAARLVGPQGKVIYVEPNRELSSRFRETCARNGLDITIVEAALGDRAGEAALAIGDTHVTAQIREGSGVRVLPASELDVPADRPCLVKIDVEGYEAKVLAGMDHLLRRDDTAFLVEVTDSWLRANGDSAAGMFALMNGHGYRGFVVEDSRRGPTFAPVQAARDEHQYDVLWVRSPKLLERIGAN